MAGTVMGNMIAADNQLDVDVYARGEDGRGVVSQTLEYQVGDTSTTIPTGTWSSDPIEVPQGKYLWTRTTFTYNDDTVMVSYNISYFPVNGATYTPSVDADGVISWTNDAGKPNPEPVNIKGPKGDMGSVKILYVNELPVSDIQYDAFYVTPAAHPSTNKHYDEYFYHYEDSRWEVLGDDLTPFYDKTQINQMFADFVADFITIYEPAADTTYYLTGVENTGNKRLNKSGISYSKEEGASKGTGEIDGDTITTNLFYSIS